MTTLYGTLIGRLAADYEKQTSALHKNTGLINRFGDLIAPWELTPHIKTVDSANISLVAVAQRGRNNEQLFDQIRDAGFQIEKPTKLPQQFNDGYVMWTANVTCRAIAFCLLFYTEQDVS